MGRWQETIGHGVGTAKLAGTERKLPVQNEQTGKNGGHHIEHWDGSQDAVIRPSTVKMKLRLEGG